MEEVNAGYKTQDHKVLEGRHLKQLIVMLDSHTVCEGEPYGHAKRRRRIHLYVYKCEPCEVGPCYHSMAHSPVVGGGNDLQMWRVSADILNKQSRTTDKGWSSNLRDKRKLTTLHCENRLMQNVAQGIRNGRIVWKDLGGGKCMRFESWTARSLT